MELGEAFVSEYAHLAKYLLENPGSPPELYDHATEAERAYLDSIAPVEETHLDGFCLPELIVTKRIPAKDIRVSNFQPLLEERIAREAVNIGPRKDSIELFAKMYLVFTPELAPWFEGFTLA